MKRDDGVRPGCCQRASSVIECNRRWTTKQEGVGVDDEGEISSHDDWNNWQMMKILFICRRYIRRLTKCAEEVE